MFVLFKEPHIYANVLPVTSRCAIRGIYERAYEEQEKRIKYTGLLANCIMLDNTVEISTALNALAKEGLIPTIDELAALSPYQTRHIKRLVK